MNSIENQIQQIIDILSKDNSWIQNLISTSVGVVLGFFLTILASNWGRLKCFYIDHTIQFYSYDVGEQKKVSYKDNPMLSQFEITLDIHNTSAKNVGIRNTHIKFQNNKKSFSIKDNDSRINYGGRIHSNDIEVINIGPYETTRLNLTVMSDLKDIIDSKSSSKFYFCFRNSNNRLKSIKMSKLNYDIKPSS